MDDAIAKILLTSIDQMQEGLQIIGRDFRYLFVNETVAKQGKKSKEELVGKTMMECYPGIEKTPLFAQINDCLEKNASSTMKNEFVYSDGSKGWFQLFMHPINEGVLILSADVTEFEKVTKALLEKEERLRQIVDNINEFFFSVTADYSEMLYVSPAYERIWKRKLEDVYKNPMAWSEAIIPEDRVKVFAATAAGVASGSDGYEMEFRIAWPDGTIRWINAKSMFIKDESGKIYRFTGVARDITAEKEAEAHAKELNTLKNKFIQIVSHQFRTPLNAVRWNLETLLGDELGKLPEAQHEFVRLTHDAATLVIRRLRDLLTALDIEEGNIRLEKDTVDLSSLAAGVMGASAKVCAVRGSSCTFVPMNGAGEVTADAEKIRMVIEKLVENAVAYTEKNGAITCALEKKGERYRVTVTDNGIGIPKAEQKRVFNRFFRASNASTSLPDASGLGLYIAKYFVEAHGGTIGFESEEGKGSTFWFEIPVEPPSA